MVRIEGMVKDTIIVAGGVNRSDRMRDGCCDLIG